MMLYNIIREVPEVGFNMKIKYSTNIQHVLQDQNAINKNMS